ncbi:hypothetical protein P7L79_12810 [Tistrella mobilis]|uniref:phage capsid protein n=1 Tax=Tistrella mobilis TaxID=171437 RepID=UPI003555FDF2
MTSTNGRPWNSNPETLATIRAYSNPSLIADRVLPYAPPIRKREFTWNRYPTETLYTMPEDGGRVGRRSAPRRVEFLQEPATGATEDYGLSASIPQEDIDAASADGESDPVLEYSYALWELVKNLREIRVAQTVFNPSTYATNHVETPTGSDLWSDPASDPLGQFLDARSRMLFKPTKAVFGGPAWLAFSTHPKIVKAVNGNSGDAGMATEEQAKRLLRVSEIAIGEAMVNTAKPRQPASMVDVWGASLLLIHQPISSAINPKSPTPAYGCTVQTGDRFAMQRPDPDASMRGGVEVRVGETVKELVQAPELGFLLHEVV